MNRILLIGANGFIGSNLIERILNTTSWHVYGMDINNHYLTEMLDHKRFHFTEGDVFVSNEWIEYHIKKCDIVLPLVAIAQPKVYVNDPLAVFELDFEANLKIIRWVHKYGRRLILPSTSEVYGMCEDERFSEEESNLVYGPIVKTRWIYASCKQLLDRVVYAYGRDRHLRYAIFRPFNWIGARLDTMESARHGNSRVLTQFITNLHDGAPIQLVDKGEQRRTFTDIADGLDALMAILADESSSASRIFNLGNPNNEISIAQLADMTRALYAEETGINLADIPAAVCITSDQFYGSGKGYQDINHRVPTIDNAREFLGWNPSVSMEVSVRAAVRYFVENCPNSQGMT